MNDLNHGLNKSWPSSPLGQPLAQPMFPGKPWPKIAVTILSRADASPDALERTRRSVLHQNHPDVELIEAVYGPNEEAQHVLQNAWRQTDAAYQLALAPGEMLAPDALASACLWLALHPADILAGLRVFYDGRGPHCIDVAATPGLLDPESLLDPERLSAWLSAENFVPLRLGEVLFARTAVDPAFVLGPDKNPIANVLTQLAQRHARLGVLARPFLLVETPPSSPAPVPGGLRIAALNDLGFEMGGASIAHRRLIDALKLAGHHVDIFRLADDAPAVAAEWTQSFPKTEQAIAAEKYHLILVGNIHGVTRNADLLSRLNAHTPVAAVIHDLFLLSGRCAVSLDCPAIYRKCGDFCPTADEYPYLAPQRIEAAWEGKRRFLAMQPPPMLLANSSWTAVTARKALGPGLADVVHTIDLAFPSQIFRLQDRKSVRRKLGLPEDDILILCSAIIAAHPYKGGADLRAIFTDLARPGVGFVVLGRIDRPEDFNLPNMYTPGLIAQEERLADYYAACDLYVTASRQETLGQTPIEAGLCGAPSAAYRCEGLETAVLDGVSGLLAEPTIEALKANVIRLVEDAALRRSLATTGNLALEARNNYAASYLSLYVALGARGLLPPAGRIGFLPDILRTFADAQDRLPSDARVFAKKPRFLMQFVRRVKTALWGGARLPRYVRRAMYETDRLRRLARRL